jgi:murein DD-endopeptidase MepM/ murein hydrolase activator NlpD
MSPQQQRHWPLPGFGKLLPARGTPGSFWEDRGDRCHGGLDLYAPPGSPVVAVEDGKVISVGIFTSQDLVPYWNRTFEVTISHVTGIFCRYAELGDMVIGKGAPVSGGEVIGHVGEVLNPGSIGANAPPYIRSLKEHGHGSMLHFEAYSAAPVPSPAYLGGNWFTRERPDHLLDPAVILRDAL